jgi:hypothetical protein
MLRKYPNRVSLLGSDTDSFLYRVQTPDLYSDMLTDIALYDTSNYPVDHPLFSELNKKKPGVMKDELGGKPAHTFIGLKSKLYALSFDKQWKKVGKGVKKSVLQNIVTPAHYNQCLNDHTYFSFEQTAIRSFKHTIYNIVQNKLSLSTMDCKRYICDDGIRTLAYGHYKIKPCQ